MKITQQVRDYAAKLNEKQSGMDEISEEFREMGGKVCVEAEEYEARHRPADSSIAD